MKAAGWLMAPLVLACIGCSDSTASCDAGRVALQMLGTRGPELLDGRASTGYLVWLDGKARVIVDAGPGSAQRFEQSGARYEDVELVLFTHFHVDHSGDFPAYIKGGFFTDRTATLNVIGPSGNELVPSANEFVERLFSAKNGVWPYLDSFIDSAAPSRYKVKTTTVPWSIDDLAVKQVYRSGDFTVSAVAVHHGAFPALGYRVEAGGCTLAFTGDMSGRLGRMPELARDADILVAHNAVPEDATGVAALLHMKPSYIGELAAAAQVKNLLLTHLMARTLGREQETIALIRKKYGGPVEFPADLDVVRPGQ